MKYVWKTIKGIVIGVWVLVAVLTTICLISYNDYKVSEFGKYSLVIIDNKDLEPNFKEKDLVILAKGTEASYEVGDYIFFYTESALKENFVNYGQITNIQKEGNAEAAYYIGDAKVNYSKVIGEGNEAVIYHNVGLALSIIESRWGYMFLVILPTLFAFVYEIYAIVVEVKKEAKKEQEEE